MADFRCVRIGLLRIVTIAFDAKNARLGLRTQGAPSNHPSHRVYACVRQVMLLLACPWA